MRKIELIELVQDHLAGGDAPDDVKGRYHPEILANYLALAFNEVIMATYLEAKRHSDYSILDAWALNYTISISGVSGTNGYVLLPYPPVALPNAMGIRQVSKTSDLTSTFAYRDTNANSVFASLEVGTISTKPIFYLEMNTGSENNTHVLKLEKIPDSITEVLVKLIVPLEQIDEYDTIAIPAGKEKLIIDVTIDVMRRKNKEDEINDNKVSQQ